MSQVFPIWISNIAELDQVYQGQHLLRSDLCRSAQVINQIIIKLHFEIEITVRDQMAEEPLLHPDSRRDFREEIIKLRRKLYEKQGILREINKQLDATHQFLKRLSDPSVPQELKDEYQVKRRREALVDMTKNLEKEGYTNL